MTAYLNLMFEIFKFLVMGAVIFAIFIGCVGLTQHVLVRVFGSPEGTVEKSDFEVASIFIGLVLAGIIIVPPIIVFVPPYENPEATKAAKACRDAAFAEGQSAAENGIPCEACPYGFNKQRYSITATAEYSAWMRGWTAKTIELKKGTK